MEPKSQIVKLSLYLVVIGMKLWGEKKSWGRDQLQHWEAQVSIPSTSEASHKTGDVLDKGIENWHQDQLQNVKAVHR